MTLIHIKTGSILYGMSVLSCLWLAGSRVKSVPDRLKALQKHWGAGSRDSNMQFYILCLVCVTIFGLIAFYYWYRHWQAKVKEERKILETARAMGLIDREFKLLFVISAGNQGGRVHRLLHSLSFFDEMGGAYLRRLCAQSTRPGPVVAALSSIRKKLCASLEESETVQPGLREIPLLSTLDIINTSNKSTGITRGHLVERQSNRLRIVGVGKRALRAWKAGDYLRIKTVDSQENPLEFLVQFRFVEFKASGLILVEFEHATSPALGGYPEHCTLRYHVMASHPTGGTDKGLLHWISPVGAHLRSPAFFPAGDEITLLVESESSKTTVKIPCIVVYCSRRKNAIHALGLRFDSLSEEALKIIEILGTYSERGVVSAYRR